MSAETVTVTDNPDAQRFEAVIDGHTAFAEYRLIKGAIMFTHTEVPQALGGRGIGSALVKAGLKAARERELKVMPVCPFFSAYFGKHPEERDLLHPSYRIALGL
ncbi:GNAT family N-acetyltransferase [Phreatobacter sp.]|uniref:GNAT family N-acetyltransferase n=1 Tax=Phreatobacter sp. TaxID=1966341 RepID=UPI003F71D93C